ncbi:helix-turn-helix domain-containing protein [Hoeflea sp.]
MSAHGQPLVSARMIAKKLEIKPQSALRIVGEFGLRGGFWGII